MNIAKRFPSLGITNTKSLTEKKQQTDKKIQYVSAYVRLWAYVMLERLNTDTVNFIDCMSNAGVYRDGDCCTAIEVLRIFSELADDYPQKSFRVFCNDYDPVKIQILKKIVGADIVPPKKNVHLFVSQKDVNDYLADLAGEPKVVGQKNIFAYGTSTILYVDPFDFGTVEIPKVSAVLKNHYCELIFNFFTSDYTRNFAKDRGRIAKCLGGKTISSREELIEYMRSQLRVGKIEHLFAYRFKTQKNVELYQIVFATPSIRGLEKLKEALWSTFKGAEFHRNKGYVDDAQTCLFTDADEQVAALASYSGEAKEWLCDVFSGSTVSWADIERFLIENTMLTESQIIRNVLKPLIDDGKVKKCNLCGKTNFKKDSFTFVRQGDCV